MTPKNRQVNSSYQSLVFVCGDDDFEVKVQCQNLWDCWKKEEPNAELEIIDGQANQAREALDRISALKEALETYPLFGSRKFIWFRHCNFLADGRSKDSEPEDSDPKVSNPVGDALEGLLASLKRCDWKTNKLLISAASVDKKKRFYKWLKQVGEVIFCESLAKQGEAVALRLVESEVRRSSKVIRREVAHRMVELVGLDRGTLVSECEKAILHSGDSKEVAFSDVEATVSPTRQAEDYKFVEAVAERNLEEALARLEDEIWSMKTDSRKSELGFLYGLVSKFRTLLLVKDAMENGLLRPASYKQLQSQMSSLNESMFPKDRRFNLLVQHPFVISKAMSLVGRYRESELVRILEVLLEANQQMVFASADPVSVLCECVIKIVLREGTMEGGGLIRR